MKCSLKRPVQLQIPPLAVFEENHGRAVVQYRLELGLALAQRSLRAHPVCHVADRRAHENSLLGLERAEADFDRELSSIPAPSKQCHPRPEESRLEAGEEVLTSGWAPPKVSLGY